MKIGFVVNAFPALSETFVLNQVTGLLDLGHEVEVFASLPRTPLPTGFDAGGHDWRALTRVRPRPPRSRALRAAHAAWLLARHGWRAPRVLARCLSRRRHGRAATSLRLLHDAIPHLGRRAVDAWVCHFGPNGQRALRLRAVGALTGPVATFFHGYDLTEHLERHGEAEYGTLLREGDLFLPISRRWLRRLVELGCPEDRLAVHHMGIDTRRFTFRERRPEAGEPLRLVTVGRLVEKKGHETLLRALALLRRDDVAVRAIALGDGPLAARLESLAGELGIRDVIDLAGAASHSRVARELASAHVLVAPSVTAANGDQEGIPVALMEAMASGLPVVSTEHSGIPELVEDGASGFLVPERDHEALAERLKWLAAHGDAWAALGRAGRAMVEREFDVARLNTLLAARLEVLARDGGAAAARVDGTP